MVQGTASEMTRALHALVIHRIYHEDQLFAQRTYVLSTIHAFLMAAFAILLSTDKLLAALLTILGVCLATFQALYGRQAAHAIDFWRKYARLVETESGIKFDTCSSISTKRPK